MVFWLTTGRALRGIGRSRSWHRVAGAALLVAVLGLAHGARAQFTRFQAYDDAVGLQNLVVSALGQDGDGAMLFGTQSGLFRYDGGAAVRYGTGLPVSAWIKQIVFDDAGRLWVLSIDGLFVRVGGAPSPFRRVDLGGAPALDDASLAVGSGQVWLDNDGALRVAPLAPDGRVGRFAPVFGPGAAARDPALARIRFVAPDRAGGILIGCGTAVCRFASGRIELFDRSRGVPDAAWQTAVRSEDGTVWLRSLDRLAWRRPGAADFTAVGVPGEGGGYADNPLALLDDRHGGVLTTNDDGVLDRTPAGWRALRSHGGGLPKARLWALLFDREGSLWAGSQGAGAFRSLGLGRWEHWTAADGLPDDDVWSIARPPGGPVWVATGSGTAPLDDPTARLTGAAYALATTRNGRLWVAPVSGPLLRRDGATGAVERFPSVGVVLQALVDGDNRLWLSTRSALFMIDDADAPAAVVHAALVLPERRVEVATDGSGSVWAASRAGVFRAGRDGRLTRVTAGNALNSTPYGLGVTRSGEIWVGTAAAGVARFRMHGDVAEALPPIRAPVIGSDQVVLIERDAGGVMWVGTDHGLDRFDGRGWRHVTTSDGLLSDDIDEFAGFVDGDGSLWIGSSRGVSHLIDVTEPPATALHPIITDVQFGDQAFPVDRPALTRWSAAPLVIHVADPDYLPGGGIVFRYRLCGLDPRWHTTGLREIQYAGVPATALRFEVVAVDTLHGTVSRPVAFELTIRSPWWRRWWSGALYALLFAGLVGAAWQVRVRMLLEQRRRLEATVQARTAEIEHARRELQRLALIDGLTGLPNRRAIMQHLENTIGAPTSTPVAVLLCDIDHFKSINDGFGHLAGDSVLAMFGERLRRILAPNETAGRYGGEEFLLVFALPPDEARARVAVIMRALASEHYPFGGAFRAVTISGGLVFLRPGEAVVDLIGRADGALYEAKESGRDRILEERADGGAGAPGRVPWHRTTPPLIRAQREPGTGFHDGPELERLFRQRRDLRRDLHAALAGGEFELHYQPVVDVARRSVTLCEALLRWRSPTRGAVSPADFIPFAEEIGLMPAIGDWALRDACRTAASWPNNLRVAVNLSPVQFRQPELVDRIVGALDDARLAPDRLEIEVTETAIIDDVANATTVLRQLRTLGVTVALDDFGTGYSSLSFLRLLPFDRLKIDRSFVGDLGISPEARSIVGAVTSLGDNLGVAVTAEGIETDAQMALLREVGCTELQGYLIARPCAAAELRRWLAGFAAAEPAAIPA